MKTTRTPVSTPAACPLEPAQLHKDVEVGHSAHIAASSQGPRIDKEADEESFHREFPQRVSTAMNSVKSYKNLDDIHYRDNLSWK